MARKKASKASMAEVATEEVPNGHSSPKPSTALPKGPTSPPIALQTTVLEPSAPTLVICRHKYVTPATDSRLVGRGNEVISKQTLAIYILLPRPLAAATSRNSRNDCFQQLLPSSASDSGSCDSIRPRQDPATGR